QAGLDVDAERLVDAVAGLVPAAVERAAESPLAPRASPEPPGTANATLPRCPPPPAGPDVASPRPVRRTSYQHPYAGRAHVVTGALHLSGVALGTVNERGSPLYADHQETQRTPGAHAGPGARLPAPLRLRTVGLVGGPVRAARRPRGGRPIR